MKNSSLALSVTSLMAAMCLSTFANADQKHPVMSRCDEGDVQFVVNVTKKDNSSQTLEIPVQAPIVLELGDRADLKIRIRNRNPDQGRIGAYYLPTAIYSAMGVGLGSMGMNPSAGSVNVYLMPKAGEKEVFNYQITDIQQRMPKGWNIYNILDKCQMGTVTIQNKTKTDLVKAVAARTGAVVAGANLLLERAGGFTGRQQWEAIKPAAQKLVEAANSLQAAAQQSAEIEVLKALHDKAREALRQFRRTTMVGEVVVHTSIDFRTAVRALREITKLIDPNSVVSDDAAIHVTMIKPGFMEGSWGPKDGLTIAAYTAGIRPGTIVDAMYSFTRAGDFNTYRDNMYSPPVEEKQTFSTSAPVGGQFSQNMAIILSVEDVAVWCNVKANSIEYTCQNL